MQEEMAVIDSRIEIRQVEESMRMLGHILIFSAAVLCFEAFHGRLCLNKDATATEPLRFPMLQVDSNNLWIGSCLNLASLFALISITLSVFKNTLS
jgi:hypothetical protein